MYLWVWRWAAEGWRSIRDSGSPGVRSPALVTVLFLHGLFYVYLRGREKGQILRGPLGILFSFLEESWRRQ